MTGPQKPYPKTRNLRRYSPGRLGKEKHQKPKDPTISTIVFEKMDLNFTNLAFLFDKNSLQSLRFLLPQNPSGCVSVTL